MNEQTQGLPDNVGEVGLKSIRIGGMKIQDLGMVAQAHVRAQIPLMVDTERRNRIEDLIAKFPTHRVDYLQFRIKESKSNIMLINKMLQDQQTMIDEYRQLITLCDFRDGELIRLENDEDMDVVEKRQAITALKRKFPPYNVGAMEQQILQAQEAIERGDDVIARDAKDIEEHAGLLGMCEIRDQELLKLGVRQTAGNV